VSDIKIDQAKLDKLLWEFDRAQLQAQRRDARMRNLILDLLGIPRVRRRKAVRKPVASKG